MTMWKTVAIAALLVLPAVPVHADPAADAHALGEAFGKAVASGDVNAVLDLYADDCRVIYPGKGEEAKGKEALRAMLERELPTMKNIAMVQKSSDAIAVDDAHVMNVGRWEMPAASGR